MPLVGRALPHYATGSQSENFDNLQVCIENPVCLELEVEVGSGKSVEPMTYMSCSCLASFYFSLREDIEAILTM